MKKKTLFTAVTLCSIMLVNCGSTESSSDTSTISNSSISSSAQGEATNPFNEEYFISQIQEFPVTIQGVRFFFAFSQKYESPDEYELYMTDCSITDLGLTSITAQGILTDGTHSTEEPVSIQYELSYADDGSSCVIVNAIAPEEALMLTPAVPVSIDDLYNKPVTILNPDNKEEIGVLEEYTMELDPDGWRDNYRYSGFIYIIDSEGKRYVTHIEHSFSFDSTSSRRDDWHWAWSGGTVLYVYEVTE